MKRFLKNLFLGLSLIIAFPAMGEGLDGNWTGNLQVNEQVKLKLVFHISKDESGASTVTMDSPDQGAFGIPVEVNEMTSDFIRVAVPAINMIYEGTLKDGKIEGTFSQNGMTLPLQLETETPQADEQPSEQLPFPHTKDDLKIFKKKPTDITFA